MIRKLLSITLYGLLLTALFAGVLAMFFAVVGCVENRPPTPRGIAATGNAIQRADAHAQSAKAAITKAIPEATTTGKVYLGVGVEEIDKSRDDMAEGMDDNAQSEADFDIEHYARLSSDAEVSALKHSWGHRLQVWLTWGFWIFMGLLAFHFVGGIVGAFLPSVWGIGLRWAAALVNPLAWGQKLIDGLHVKVKAGAVGETQ